MISSEKQNELKKRFKTLRSVDIKVNGIYITTITKLDYDMFAAMFNMTPEKALREYFYEKSKQIDFIPNINNGIKAVMDEHPGREMKDIAEDYIVKNTSRQLSEGKVPNLDYVEAIVKK